GPAAGRDPDDGAGGPARRRRRRDRGAVRPPAGAHLRAPPAPRRGDRDSPEANLMFRPALLGILALTALLYVWGLDGNGYANSFYAAAVLAGTKSWTAFFFGSFDAASFITVDKPPAALWLMALSGRLFGFSSWSMLLP